MSNVDKLHEAVEENNVTLVRNLVENGADVNVVYERETAFTKAVLEEHYETADVIMNSELFNPNSGNYFDRTPLFMVAMNGKPEFVRKLLALGADIEEADMRGVTPLGATALCDKYECASILIDHGANVDATDATGQSPLLKACSNISKNVVRVLIANNCNLDLPSKDTSTPLTTSLPLVHNYVVAGKKISDMLEVSQILVDAGCDINKQDRAGQTPLHRAVDSNDIYSLCFLAENDCILDIKNSNGHTPFQMALLLKKPRYEAARFLLYFGANTEDVISDPDFGSLPASPLAFLMLTTHRDDPDIISAMTSLLGKLWHTVDPRTVTPEICVKSLIPEKNLPYSASLLINIWKWLDACSPCSLQHQIRLQIRRRFQGTNVIPKIRNLPIPNALKTYLNLGLCDHSIPLSNICKLYIYIQEGNNEKVKELIIKGVHLGAEIRHKRPLALAVTAGNMLAARMLIETAPQKHLKKVNDSGDSVLHLIARHGAHKLLNFAMDKFKGTDHKNHRGVTPLEEAVETGNFNIAVGIIKNDPKVSISYCCGLPILHIAAGSGQTHFVDLLLKKGQDPNMEDRYGNTPLHVAASKGSEYLMRSLHYSRQPQSQVPIDLSSLSIGMVKSRPKQPTDTSVFIEVINLLIDAGADPRRINKQSCTAFQCAVETKDQVLLQYLKEKNWNKK